jgi:hypothetical protein
VGRLFVTRSLLVAHAASERAAAAGAAGAQLDPVASRSKRPPSILYDSKHTLGIFALHQALTAFSRAPGRPCASAQTVLNDNDGTGRLIVGALGAM